MKPNILGILGAHGLVKEFQIVSPFNIAWMKAIKAPKRYFSPYFFCFYTGTFFPITEWNLISILARELQKTYRN